MKTQRKQPARRDALIAFAFLLIAFTFLLSTAMPTLAQLPPGPPADRTNPDRERQQDINRREMVLRGYGLTPARPNNQKKLQALADQVEQDFSRILILHNEIARAISGANSLDYDFVSGATSEIRKRASRLQATLVLKPEASEQTAEKQIGLDDKQVRYALIILCKQIKSFVTNPVIQNPGTVNVDQLNKARQDLQSVVELSLSVKRTAEKLSKAAK
jgi:hypothetical protein